MDFFHGAVACGLRCILLEILEGLYFVAWDSV